MTRWLLRVEGVNFSQTVYDTSDLSTIRGGSLALLRLDQAVERALAAIDPHARLVFNGASQCAFDVSSDQTEEALEKAVRDALAQPDPIPFRELMTVIALVTLDRPDDVEAALKLADARGKARQFGQWTVSPINPKQHAARADALQHILPGTDSHELPPGKVLPLDDEDGRTSDTVLVSASVLNRRKYGVWARQGFYEDEIKEIWTLPRTVSFVRHVQDMVDAPPDVPLSLKSKIAIVYADGNKFGDIRKTVGTEAFSANLKELRRGLLARILRWLTDGAGDSPQSGNPFAIKDRRIGLRFETLMWGGDEFVFVMPAWLAFAFARGFCAATRGWRIGDRALTHAVGIAIAHHKTPIRQLKDIAKQTADLAKDAGLQDRTTVSVEIFESLAPPDREFAAYRQQLYGVADGHRLARWLAIPGDRIDAVGEAMRRLTAEDGFPRSQIYGALRAVRETRVGLADAAATQAVERHLEAYQRRAGGTENEARLRANRLPGVEESRPIALDLALISQFWDYANPLGAPLGSFAEGVE